MGREEHCKQTSVVCMGNAPSVLATLGFPPLTECVLSQSTLPRLQVALQGAGPGLRAFPRSKPLRFRFLDIPQRHRLSWACVLCPSQVRAAQATRCLAIALSSGGTVWKLLLFQDSLPGMGLHPFLFCLSFCLLYFVLPPFKDSGLPFSVPHVLCQH